MKGKNIFSIFFIALTFYLCYQFLDRQVYHWTQALPRPVIDIFEVITHWGESGRYLIVSAAAFFLFRYGWVKKTWSNRALFVFSAVALSGVMINIIKVIFGRMRPLLLKESGAYGFDFFRIGYEYASFPSGHATTAFALAVSLSLLYPSVYVRFFAFLFALAVAMSRVIIGVHYLGDALVGAYVGTVTALALKDYFERRRVPL